MRIPSIDETIGIEAYGSQTPGIGGVIRESADDFVVEEILVDNSVASVERHEEGRGLGASLYKQDYLLCILVKRNWDTLAAATRVARELGINETHVQIAGIKDARAVTAQYITIRGVSIEEVVKVKIRDLEVRPLGYFRDEIAPFYLLGNRFRIIVKAIKHEKPVVKKRIAGTMSKLESVGGIPNFFGHQRFGTKRPISHMVGKYIVKGNVEEAAMIFLTKTYSHEHPESIQARRDLRSTHDFGQALRDFPKQLRYERLMLFHLVEKPNDFIGAFKCLPIRLQELFVQAYQSYLFNLFLSKRLQVGFALNKAETGDFVVKVDRYGLLIPKTGRNVSLGLLAETNELIKAGRMTVAQPLIGANQGPSEGFMGETQRKILAMEGVEKGDFRVCRLRNIIGKGGLRGIVSSVKEFKVQSIELNQEFLKTQVAEFSFTLLRGSYATMLLRELMKPTDPVSSGF